MWKPVGPLPAAVYWRRRFVAIASVLAVLVAATWVAVVLIVPASDEPVARTTERAAMSAPQQADPSPAQPSSGTGAPGSATAPTGTTTGTTPGSATGVTPPAGTPEALATTGSGAPATTSEVLMPDYTPRASVSVAAPVPVPPTGPVPCTNDMISVTAEIDAPEHRVGDRPTLRLVVVNASDQPCVRDLDAERQEIVVWSGDGADRLWSSNDCVNPSTEDLRTLVPGQPVAFAVRWVGRTSVPGCAAARTMVPAGSYRVMTRVDDVISAPTPFLRNP